MESYKKLNTVLVIVIATALLTFVFFWLRAEERPKQAELEIKQTEVVISEEGHNMANDYQHFGTRESVYLGADGGKLHYMIDRGLLMKFGDDILHNNERIHDVIMLMDGYAFSLYNDKIYSSNLQEGTMTEIGSLPKTDLNEELYYFYKDEIFYVQANSEGTLYYPIHHEYIGEPVRQYPFTLGGRNYAVQGEEIVCYDSEGNRSVLNLPYGEWRTMFPCEKGLLIHNYGQKNPLYIVEEDGELVELFPVEGCNIETAVNTWKNYVYISIMRYEEFSTDLSKGVGIKGGYVPYENDTFVGTYRICLDDYSAEKISDEIYSELYIFDGTGIYAAKENGETVKLDFNGKVIDILITYQTKD